MNTPTLPPPQNSSFSEDLDTTRSTILVVDDNAQNVELLQAYLEALPCQILTAADGIEAMRLIEKAEAAFEKDVAEKQASRLMSGEFSLQDFADQLRQLRKMHNK